MKRQYYLEIRDDGTLIPALVFELSNNPATRRAGFNDDNLHLVLMKLVDFRSEYDPHKWGDIGRTMKLAHLWLYDNWNTTALRNGFVLDVEFAVLKERESPKTSELIGDWTE